MESHEGFPQGNQYYLPIELVTEVYVRLPVKSLLRFRCVCKSWYSLISSSEFASLHLSHYHLDDDDDDVDENTPFLASDFEGRTWLLPRHNPTCHERITCTDHHLLHRGPSVNGLLLRSTLGVFSYTKQTHSIMLWNPSIRKVRELPPLCVDHRVYFGLGYGYSRSSNDYKVVAIATNIRNSVRICSLSNPQWRRLDHYREDIIRGVDSDGVFIDGHIYWISSRNSIISFDVNDEVFNYILLPMERGSQRNFWRYPTAYRGSLGLLELCSQGTCSLWAMTTNTDQVLDSWSKLYTIDFQAEIHPLSILYFMNGKMIFVKKNGVLALYDFDRKQLRKLSQSPGSRICYFSLYKESLVLL